MRDTRNIDALTEALHDLMGCMNSPRQDEFLLQEAGVSLDRALFPLLVRLSRTPCLGIAEVADQMGRDPSTISRQIARLEESGLVRRKPNKTDLRVRPVVVTPAGIRMLEALVGARRRLLDRLLGDWTASERACLPVLLHRLAAAMRREWNG